MNTLRFRVWDSTAGKMLFFEGIFNKQPYTEGSTFPQYESCPKYHELSVMPSTGMRDRNGAEVYLHDIIKMLHALYLVKWDEKTAGFSLTPTDTRDTQKLPIFHIARLGDKIGNMYENPELLCTP